MQLHFFFLWFPSRPSSLRFQPESRSSFWPFFLERTLLLFSLINSLYHSPRYHTLFAFFPELLSLVASARLGWFTCFPFNLSFVSDRFWTRLNSSHTQVQSIDGISLCLLSLDVCSSDQIFDYRGWLMFTECETNNKLSKTKKVRVHQAETLFKAG